MTTALNRYSLKIVRALRGECFWFLSHEVFAAERWASAVAGSGSDAGADAGGSRLDALVRPGLASKAIAVDASVSALGFLPGASALTTAIVRTDPVREAPSHDPQVAATSGPRG